MNQKRESLDFYSRVGLDRNKFIAIVALSLVLIVVLYVQFGGSSKPAPVVSANKTSLKKKKSNRRSSGKSMIEKKVNQAKKVAAESQPIQPKGNFRSRGNASKRKPKSIEVAKTFHPPKESGVQQQKWPSVDVSGLQFSNPFDLPQEIEKIKAERLEKLKREKEAAEEKRRIEAEQQRQAQIKQALGNLQQQGIRMVYISGNERVAQIGSRIVKVGDVIDGIRISEIRENGSVILDVTESVFASTAN